MIVWTTFAIRSTLFAGLSGVDQLQRANTSEFGSLLSGLHLALVTHYVLIVA